MRNLVHLVIGISFFIILSSCEGSGNKKLSVNQFDKETHSLHDLSFNGGKIWLPKYFQSINLDELKLIADNNDPKDTGLIEFYEPSKAVSNTDKKPLFFQSQLMPSDVIAVQPTGYIVIKKEEASYAVSALLASIEKNTQSKGINIEIIEKRFKTFDDANMIKIKTLQSYLSRTQYVTQYYITKGFKSYVVTVKSEFPDDYEKYVKAITFN